MLVRSSVIILALAGLTVLLLRPWPEEVRSLPAGPQPTPQALASQAFESTADRSAYRPVPRAQRGDPAEFAPRHTRPGIELTAYFESVEPLPPGVAPLPTPQGRAPGAAAPSKSRPEAAAGRPARSPNEPVPLLNGVDLAGWEVQDGKLDAWEVVDGVLRCTRGGGGWLRTLGEYSDLELSFEYRLSPGANTGVGLRFADSGSPTATGLEIQLIDDSAPKYAGLRPDQYSGSLYYLAAPMQRPMHAPGEWHACRIVLSGSRIRVLLNEVLVNDFDLNQRLDDGRPHPASTRRLVGRIGFQSSAAPVEFRAIMLRELDTVLPSGLRLMDLADGDGPACRADDVVTIDYVGRFPDGRTFDSSYNRGVPATLKVTETIEGWRQGLPGLRVGGRRKLVVPPHLGYGAAGVGNLIPPDSTLIFEVELRGLAH